MAISRAARPARLGVREETVDNATLADLRYQLRRFERIREVAARAARVAPQQYLALLQIKGLERRGAGCLQIHHHAAVQLVDRLVPPGHGRAQAC